jgi:CDGSH-type Zn-finger protein
MNDSEIEEEGRDSSETRGKRSYCVCGLSSEMPWCDGSHTGRHRPRRVADAAKDLGLEFCTCGKTSKAPFCEPGIAECVHHKAAPG